MPTTPQPLIGRLPVRIQNLGCEVTKPLVETASGVFVTATGTIRAITRHGARATVVLVGAGDSTAALRVDAHRARAFAHRLVVGAEITVRGNTQRVGTNDTGMPVIDLLSVIG